MGLCVPQSSFNHVGVDFNNVTCCNIAVEGSESVLVQHCEVPVPLTIQITEGAPPVAVHSRAWNFMALDDRQKIGAQTIIDRVHDHGVSSPFHHAKDPYPQTRRWVASMVLYPPPKQTLINLNLA